MDIFFIILIIGLGLLFINSFKNQLDNNNINTLKKLFFYHLIFGVYYCFFTKGDSIGYWNFSKDFTYQEVIEYLTDSKGTYFLYAVNYFPANLLGLSYFTGTMFYSLLGFIGLTYFYIIAYQMVPYNSKYKNYNLFPLLFYFPSLHFWSCAVGKDSLLFFCIGVFFYGLMKPLRRVPLIIFALLLSYFIRPHMTLFMILSFGITYMLGSKISTFQRVFFTFIMIGITIAILPTVMSFAKVEEASVTSFNEFSENKAALLSRGTTGSAIDISSYPFPLKVFTFLFRPLFFDINGIPSLLASIENLFLLIFAVRTLRNSPLKTYKNAPFVIQGLVVFLIIGTLAFSQSLGNLGIIVRMKNMFAPGLLIFFLWSFSYQKQLRQKSQPHIK